MKLRVPKFWVVCVACGYAKTVNKSRFCRFDTYEAAENFILNNLSDLKPELQIEKVWVLEEHSQ